MWFLGFRFIRTGGKDAVAEKTALFTGSSGSGVCAAAVPHGHRQTSTFIVGLRRSGLVAPGIFADAINGTLLLAWVDHVPDPTLRAEHRPIFLSQ